jgi:hypothetical protein
MQDAGWLPDGRRSVAVAIGKPGAVCFVFQSSVMITFIGMSRGCGPIARRRLPAPRNGQWPLMVRPLTLLMARSRRDAMRADLAFSLLSVDGEALLDQPLPFRLAPAQDFRSRTLGAPTARHTRAKVRAHSREAMRTPGFQGRCIFCRPLPTPYPRAPHVCWNVLRSKQEGKRN